MIDNQQEIPSPEECTSRIFELSGTRFEPEIAANLWSQILNHKWLLSEKVGRDVGFRTAGIDFLENMEQAPDEYKTYKDKDILNEMGAQTIGRDMGYHLRFPTAQAAGPTPDHLAVNRGGPFQEARRDSSKINPLLRPSRHRKDPFCKSHRRRPFLVVHRDCTQHAYGGRGGEDRSESEKGNGKGAKSR